MRKIIESNLMIFGSQAEYFGDKAVESIRTQTPNATT